MKLSLALTKFEYIVENGPLGTRLKYDYGYNASYDLSQDEKGREILIELYKGDVEVAHQGDVPIVLNAATFRASRNHLAANGVNHIEQIRSINISNLQLISDLIQDVKSDIPIIFGAPLGSMCDAYSTENIPRVNDAFNYHKEQISTFKEMQVDFINVVTLPTVSEALGIALACDESGLEYTIGFILGGDGKLLDGTPINEAIELIDNKTNNRPIGYLVTCTHASVISMLGHNIKHLERFIGLQANGSCLPPSELAKLEKPLSDDPEQFSMDIKSLKEKFNLKILGGCCGTTREHLQHIVKACQAKSSFSISS